ncbi:MAG: hypothetical protein F6J95_026215 [Leptolyngbya sp. SIO1E4]|nr:hypothetical protein [Leptolyngbya sp. SIO1E4]
MIIELQDRRLIAAIQCVDAVVGEPIPQSLQIQGPGMRFVRNRLGLYVLTTAPGFEAYTRQFDPAALVPPPDREILLQVTDPSGQYLPRLLRLVIPRSLEAEADTSIFRPVRLPLFPAPTFTRPQPGWAIFRAGVSNLAGEPLPWALIQVTRQSNPILNALAQADSRGQALIAVPNIPQTLVSADSEDGVPDLLPDAVTATATVIFDPAVTTIPDPDDLLARQSDLFTGTLPLSVAAGRSRSISLAFDLSPPP